MSSLRRVRIALLSALAATLVARVLRVSPGARPRSPESSRSLGSGVAYEHFSAGQGLLASGNPAQAAVRLEKARTMEPGKGSVREALGRAYFALGRWDDAEREFRTLLRICPTNDYGHYCLFRVLEKRGRLQQAEAHLRLARAMGCDLRGC